MSRPNLFTFCFPDLHALRGALDARLVVFRRERTVEDREEQRQAAGHDSFVPKAGSV